MATSLEGVNKLDQPLLKIQLIGLEGNFTFLPFSMDNWKFHFISTFSYFLTFMLEGRVAPWQYLKIAFFLVFFESFT
jgi:hypothetical protein